jgi:TrmH family RNA methyltransferase
MLGDMDSLNVGVAATIIMYEAALKNKGYIKR